MVKTHLAALLMLIECDLEYKLYTWLVYLVSILGKV
jgi:hypothetical protein